MTGFGNGEVTSEVTGEVNQVKSVWAARQKTTMSRQCQGNVKMVRQATTLTFLGQTYGGIWLWVEGGGWRVARHLNAGLEETLMGMRVAG